MSGEQRVLFIIAAAKLTAKITADVRADGRVVEPQEAFLGQPERASGSFNLDYRVA